MGYKFQFITLAGFHALNLGMFEGGASSTTALTGSTEEEQFNAAVNYPVAAIGRG